VTGADTRWVFVVLIADPDDRSGLARLLEDVMLPEMRGRVSCLPAPAAGTEYFTSPVAAAWASEHVPAGPQPVYLLDHAPGLAEAITGHRGLFYIGLTTEEDTGAYAGADERVVLFISASPLDYATVIMRDFSPAMFGTGAPKDILFDEGEALRMAALSSDFPADLDDSEFGFGDLEPGPEGGYLPFGTGPGDHVLQSVWRHLPAALPEAGVVSDLWTVTDQLGYRSFAETIAAFVRHRDTRPPLTIGIRAPWGAGKTSLMRMIQEELDPRGADGRRSPVRLLGAAGQPADLPRVATALRLARRGPGETGPQRADAAPGRRSTAWFNPWMYQTSEQVWAALAHEIITQTTDRMPLAERETFWLKVNLARVDREALRRAVYGTLLGRLVSVLLVFVPFAVVGIALAAARSPVAAGTVLGAGGVVTAAGIILRAVGLYRERAHDVLGGLVRWHDPMQPDIGSAAPLLPVAEPAYLARAGLFHFVRDDIRAVLDLVATPERPLVVFIDDLDRCSPGLVAQVVEAVNVFLTGEFPNCLFVIAMEPRATVASIEAAYQDVLGGLGSAPSDGPSLGWRFLDKLVQLPFQLPPLDAARVLPNYLASFGHSSAGLIPGRAGGGGDVPAAGDGAIHAASGQSPGVASQGDTAGEVSEQALRARIGHMVTTLDQVSDVAAELRKERGTDEQAIVNAATAVFDVMFRPANPEVARVVSKELEAMPAVNAREAKRFVNLFRLYAIIGARRRLQGYESATIQEAATLAALASRWPDVVGLAAGPAALLALKDDPAGSERAGLIRLGHIDPGRLSELAGFLNEESHGLSPGALALLVG
jgi:KAP family P-loop domain